jgi:hypothetical protein
MAGRFLGCSGLARAQNRWRVAVWAYGINQVKGQAADDIVRDFYSNLVGPYWPPERQIVEEGYRTLSFPFRKLPATWLLPGKSAGHWPSERAGFSPVQIGNCLTRREGAPLLVPEVQPEISQTRSVWYRRKEIRPNGTAETFTRNAIHAFPSSRQDESNLRIKPRHNVSG